MNGAPRQRIAPLHVAGGDQGPDPGRGDGLAVDLDQRHDPGLELRRAPRASPGRPWPWRRSGSSRRPRPASRPSVSTRISSSRTPPASMLAKSRSKGITTSSSTPRPSITSRLISNGMISFGAASGWITCSGCGSKVSTVSAPSITAGGRRGRRRRSRSRRAAGAGSASGSGVTCDAHRSRELWRYGLRRLDAGRRAPRRRARLEANGARRRSGALVGLLDRRTGPIRGPPQLGRSRRRRGRDQAAHVGARRALDLELGPLALALEQLDAVDRRPRARASRPSSPRCARL